MRVIRLGVENNSFFDAAVVYMIVGLFNIGADGISMRHKSMVRDLIGISKMKRSDLFPVLIYSGSCLNMCGRGRSHLRY